MWQEELGTQSVNWFLLSQWFSFQDILWLKNIRRILWRGWEEGFVRKSWLWILSAFCNGHKRDVNISPRFTLLFTYWQKTNKQNFELHKIESMTLILWIDIEFLNLATILRHRNATFTIVVSYYGHCGNRHNHCRKGAHSIGRVLIVSTPFPQCPSKLTTIVNVATETSWFIR